MRFFFRFYNAGMTESPRKTWWKRKRLIAAILVWLVIAYPLSLWPAAYLAGRGWLPLVALKDVYAPVIALANHVAPPPVYRLERPRRGGTLLYIEADSDPLPYPTGVVARRYLDLARWFKGHGATHANDGHDGT